MKQQIDTAVILAAGMGTRLRSVVTERPKAFLSFGCKPIIAESIERLERAGVRRIILVTGYLREYFDDLAAARGNVEVVHNPDYADSGSMYSLACAGHLIDGDLLLLESDLVYEQRALDAVLESPADDCILLSGRTDAGDEVYVSGDDQRIGRMSKDRTSLNAPVIGELVGISRISKPLFDRMMKCASEMFHESLHVAYETDCLVAAAQQVAVGYRVVDDLLWGEVDDESQYLRVRDNVYPQISRQEKSMADTAGVERKVLLNPGPATTSDTVKLAQVVPDICPREDEFVRVLSDVRRDLCQIVNGSPEHTCVLFGGSGTAAVDATLNSVVPSGGKLLILNNGAYGNRMRQIAEAYRLPHEEMKFASTQAIDVSAVDRVLHGDRSISHVACVHHETTTGLLNPLPEILNAVHGHGKQLIVDAISSYAAIPIDLQTLDVDYIISTSNKCIQGMAGLSFVICRRDLIEATAEIQPRSFYLNLLQQHRYFETHGQMQFTPPVQTVYALRQAIAEFRAETYLGRHERYSESWRVLVAGLRGLGLELLLPDHLQSKILTTIVEPEDDHFDFETLHDRLFARGFTIYPGKVGELNTFRIANMGAIDAGDMRNFLEALAETLIEMGVDPRQPPQSAAA